MSVPANVMTAAKNKDNSPYYKNYDSFILRCVMANKKTPDKSSSLKTLLPLLSAPDKNENAVIEAVKSMPDKKKLKYLNALWYLKATYPILHDDWMGCEVPIKYSEAAIYIMKKAPVGFNKYKSKDEDVQNKHELLKKQKSLSAINALGDTYAPVKEIARTLSEMSVNDILDPKINVGTADLDQVVQFIPRDKEQDKNEYIDAQSKLLNMSVEEYIYSAVDDGDKPGVAIIHMGDKKSGADALVDGVSIKEHMKSVLSLATDKGLDILNLQVGGHMLWDELADCINMQKLTNIRVDLGHMGGHEPEFDLFMSQHDNVIVMGFDADVCVKLNIFGGYEHRKDKSGKQVACMPIVNYSNVITSRALLVGKGNETNPLDEPYGVLKGYDVEVKKAKK